MMVKHLNRCDGPVGKISQVYENVIQGCMYWGTPFRWPTVDFDKHRGGKTGFDEGVENTRDSI